MAKGSFGFPIARDRPVALGEVHARPNPLVQSPAVIVQLAFMTDGGSTVDNAVLAELSRARGVAAPQRDARHYAMSWGNGSLRWERHTEFSTYLYNGPAPENFGGQITDHPFGEGFNPPGNLISGVRLEVRKWTELAEQSVDCFDPTSLCYSELDQGAALAITDFRQDKDGLTRILVLERGLSPARTGAIVQRLIEIETYRTLALLALPLAQSLSPQMRKIEDELTVITQRMRQEAKSESDRMLGEITALAAELEAGAAASLYRFGASRAYHEIVEERVASLREKPVAGHGSWGAFLQRRLAPAMRTCRSIEERQANLSRKLARATALLRSWVDLELQRQNSELLTSMDHRARLQLRLQQTVEGLSVAAVSYYVVGLVGYLAKAAKEAGLPVDPVIVTGISVPVVVVAIWQIVRRIRKRHSDAGPASATSG